MKTIKRIPRPKGLTLQIRNSEPLPTRQKNLYLKKIKTNIITEYLMNGLTLNKESLTFRDLGLFINTHSTDLIKLLNEATTGLASFLDPQLLQQHHRVTLLQAQKIAWEDRSRAESQFSVLYQAQANDTGEIGYKPFVSSTVNDALRGLLASNKNILELAKCMVPPVGTSLQVNVNNPITQNNQFLGTDEALILIHKEQKSLPKSSVIPIAEIISEHDLGDCPEVMATAVSVTDGKVNNAVAPKHETRRLADEGVAGILD